MWEAEVNEPRLKAMRKLAQVFEVSMDFISGNPG
jgi:hypothetical protein